MTDLTADAHATDAHGHDGAHDGEGFAAEEPGAHHGPSDATFVKIALGLAVITAFEVWLSYADLGAFFIPLLIISMLIKFFVVVLYFMHLRFDNPLFRRMFWMGLFLAPAVYIGMLCAFHFFSA